MRPHSLSLSLLLATLAVAAPPRYADPSLPIEQRVDDLLGQLSLEEKVNLCHGAFMGGGVPRLGIPELAMLDGRQGVRPTGKDVRVNTTLLPCVLALSCTWDEPAARAFGRVLAEEMLALNKHVLLAPMINVVRSPLGGRNFENFGEDPVLAGQLAAAYVQGVQAMKVGACSCLVVANDCETSRHFTNASVDERTLREVHLLPTELSFRDGGVWTMMSANSLYNGTHCAHNRHLLQEIVKDQIGFDGVMITDWRAAYDTVPAALAGTDMTTGICGYVFGDGRLLAAVKSGEVPAALLEDKARRILRLYFRSGVIDPGLRPKGELDSPAHRKAARELGAQSIVLLKNESDVLPLDPLKVRRILVTGPAANLVLQGGGSGSVPAAVEITPLQGLQAAFGAAKITHLPYTVPLRPRVRQGAIEWEEIAPKNAPPNSTGRTDLATLAREALASDAVIFIAAGIQPSEGRDLADMELPGDQDKALAALAAANRKIIVVLVTNGAVNVQPWLAKVPALLVAHYVGQATGDALADVLTGRINPSAKLSYTFAARLADYPAHALGEWPAKLVLPKHPGDPGMRPENRRAIRAFDTSYNEGVFVGYRWLDQHQVQPVFPFGHGLSYTRFEMSDVTLAEKGGVLTVSCAVRNTGRLAGAEVVQVYVAPPKTAVARPEKELKGFAKLTVPPGESQRATITLRPSALAHYDVAAKKWRVEPGRYELQVGCSSADIRLRAATTVASTRLVDQF